MRKLFLLLLLLPVVVSAMKIETDEIDEFTGMRTVITSWEHSTKGNFKLRFRMQAGHKVLDFTLFEEGVVGKDDKLLFKSTADNIGTFESNDVYGSSYTHITGSISVWSLSAVYRGDLDYFIDNITRLVRVYTTQGYIDKKVPESDGKKFVKLYELFNQTINNADVKSSFADYNVKFLKRNRKSKSWDVVKEEMMDCLSKKEIEDIMNEWRSQSNDSYEYDVQFKKKK